jgi:cytochrome d ubiquinol oxidase subunit I
MRTSQAVTGARGVPVGYGTLVLVYVLLIVAVAWVLWRLARKPLELEPSLSAAEAD